MSRTIIELNNVVPRMKQFQFAEPVNWKINEGEHWAVIGPNGSGKTLLTDMLVGKFALKSGEINYFDNGSRLSASQAVKSVAFRDIYGIIDAQNSYYQQRWNKGDEQEVPVVRDLMGRADAECLATLVEWFHISPMMDKEVNLLSSGELRKFLIVRSLITRPRILILDNPFIGLDAGSRVILNELLERLSALDDLHIILVLSNQKDIPVMITHVLPVKEMKLLPYNTKSAFLKDKELIASLFRFEDIKDINPLVRNGESIDFKYAAIMKNIDVRYGKRTILNKLDWQVGRGEKWALLGENGSGKSTLLSLIYGDNPQAYANDITLFDRRRGTGESIWDIKKRIGYISPEMHLYYQKNVKCLDVVGSGFFDTIGLYRKCSAEQESEALEWMKVLGIEHLQDTSFLNVSSGEQRLILLARVFVKNPDLLILDEPLHGLDVVNKMKIKKLIEHFCDKDKSLIYVTHYEEEIPDVVDKRIVLKKQE